MSAGKAFSKPFLFIAVLYLLAVLYVLQLGLLHPNRNWDMLCYVGSVISWSQQTPEGIYDTLMAALKQSVPDWIYQQYKENPLSANAHAFIQQIPFCHVKPLYNLFLWTLHQTGLPLPAASWVTSTLCFTALAAVLFLWRPHYLPRTVWLLLVLALMFLGTEPFYTLACLSTPDALSTLLIIASLLSWLKLRSLIAFCIFGLLATFARPDALIPIGALTGYFAVFAPKEYRIPLLPACFFIGILLTSTVAVKHAAQGPNYTYEHFFIYSFLHKVPNPAQMTDTLSWDQYWWILSISTADFFHIERNIVLLALSALAALCYYMKPAAGNRVWIGILLITWAAWGTRFILWPAALEVRFYYGYCLILLMACGELITPYAAVLWNMLQAHRKRIQD